MLVNITMMDPVVASSVENILQWANVPHHLSVDPELVEKVELLVHDGVGGGDEECHGQVEGLQYNKVVLINKRR